MPKHDFYCGACGQILFDVVIPMAIGAKAGAPEHCDRKMTPIPAPFALDVRSDSGAGDFQKFVTTDGRGNRVEVDSLRKLRAIERQSEIDARNGEGQRMIWRRYAQDQSNADAHTIGRYDGSEQPTEESKRRFGQTLQKSQDAPAGEYGPGVSDANTSALGGD